MGAWLRQTVKKLRQPVGADMIRRSSRISSPAPIHAGAVTIVTDFVVIASSRAFAGPSLPDGPAGTSHEGTDWTKVISVPTNYRLLDPGGGPRGPQHPLSDLLGSDFSPAANDTLSRGHDLRLPHQDALFTLFITAGAISSIPTTRSSFMTSPASILIALPAFPKAAKAMPVGAGTVRKTTCQRLPGGTPLRE